MSMVRYKKVRYIGSKVNLLPVISDFVDSKVDKAISFCDIFSGTGIVARHFKSKYQIISNDIMFFSSALQKAYIENDTIPAFSGLLDEGIFDPVDYLNYSAIEFVSDPFILKNYSPFEDCHRMYFSIDNASRIDYARQKINSWFDSLLINESEYFYLLACLIEAVPFVSNIAGTYGAFLKHWDKRALQNINLKHLSISPNGSINKVYNCDSEELIKVISGDILYIDPPYNGRQYTPNYHVLETIARYDYPSISGVTGMRDYSDQKSNFCQKRKVIESFDQLIKNASFDHIFISYSSEGLMSKNEILDILQNYSINDEFDFLEIPYRRYKHTKISSDHELKEYLFYLRKYK